MMRELRGSTASTDVIVGSVQQDVLSATKDPMTTLSVDRLDGVADFLNSNGKR